MAETAPPPSIEDRFQLWLEQDGASKKDVSHETSPESEAEPEPEAAAEESDDYTPEPNAQLEGDDAPEPEAIRSFSDLAKRLEMDEEALAKHLVVSGPDGKEVSLHEALSAFRAPPPDKAEADRSRARLAELEGKEAEIAQAAEQLRQTAQALAQHIRKTEPDWARLKAENPTAYANARLEHLEQVRQLELADRQYQAARQREHEAQQAKVGEFRRDQALKLRAAVPEWSDAKVMEAELGRVEKYLLTQGITAEEMSGLSDHRDWLIARKAMQYDELQAKKPALLEKVKTLPKFVAPGPGGSADRGSGARNAKADQELSGRLKQSGSIEDAAALIAHRIEVSQRRAAGRALATGRRS